MVGITFGSKHSFDDYGLILSSKDIQTPSVKSSTVDIAGGDGVLDLTEYFGEPKFNNRTISFTFAKVQTNSEFISEWSDLQNDLNGQKVNIILDEDPDFHFIGRLSITYKRTKNITEFTFTCDCKPYKLKNNLTSVSKTGSGDVVLNNLRMKTVPKITTTSETQIVFGTTTVNLSVGTVVVPELELDAGSNTMTITSTGTTTFSYQEGGF